ncbi:Isoflavone 2'-hydroxylase [Senna tora]|uniref:Isoflavone 2'-hydroxylase n=1 Tax=Senna tora TaxID=362788 RepID=A0A834WFJ3_9FABA|nr:Isoflavone 2'-hydroxylase [Senna tora]
MGKDRFVSESDLSVSELNYLQNVISEALGLFPVVPLMIPQDCKIGGYDVPRGTMLFVNAWALQPHPSFWMDPTSFDGLEGSRELVYNFVPFGVGRRIGPGAILSNRITGLALGCLIQSFGWERPSHQQL